MPIPKKVLNAFTAREVESITGLSLPMIDYLLRMGYLRPHYGHGTRGEIRYYSYRDLIVARLIQRLRESGVELRKLKDAAVFLSSNKAWNKNLPRSLDLLVADGKTVRLRARDGFLDELRQGGQRSFAFIADIPLMQKEILRKMPARKRRYYSMENRELMPIDRSGSR